VILSRYILEDRITPHHTTRRGTDVKVVSGAASTRAEPGADNVNWFVEPGTTILGSDQGEGETHVRWDIPLPPNCLLPDVRTVTVIVACKSEHGGLHVNAKFGPATASIFLNSSPLGVIGLKTIPDGHDDFFHPGVTNPSQTIQSLADVGRCKTLYVWEPSIEASRLREDGDQSLDLVISAKVRWDIDYVALLFGMRTTGLRPRVIAAAGFVGGVVTTFLIDLAIRLIVG
jgi:hypothetical protein